MTAGVVILALTLALAATAFAAKKPRTHPRRAHPVPASAPASQHAPPSMAGPAPPTWSPEEYERRKETRELVVVSVYRPVEMEGRTVAVPREVYLQAAGDPGARLKEFVGKSLEVYRKVPVPTVVAPGNAPGAPATAPTSPNAVASATAAPVVQAGQHASTSAAVAAAPASASAPASAAPSAPAPPSTALSAVARLRALKKAQEQAKANGAGVPSAPPSAAGPVATAPASAAPASTPPAAPGQAAGPVSASVAAAPADDIVRPRPQPVPSIAMEVVIGRLQVVDIRGQVVVARVAEDGVGKPTLQAPSIVPAELPAIMAGDVARFVLEPPPPPVPPPPVPPPALSKEEQARLDAERAKAEAENQRRKHKRGKYERKVMKWKL